MPQAVDPASTVADLLRRGGADVESTVVGNSMGRTLPAGTRIRISCSAGAEHAIGTVIAYLAGGTLIGHRVIGRTRDLRGRESYLTQGDGNYFCDVPVAPEIVLGVISALRQGSEWRPIPAIPPHTSLAHTVMAPLLGMVRVLARLDRTMAAWVVKGVIVVLRRLRLFNQATTGNRSQ